MAQIQLVFTVKITVKKKKKPTPKDSVFILSKTFDFPC